MLSPVDKEGAAPSPEAAPTTSFDFERDQAWDVIAARRNAEIESGKETPVPLDEVLARLRAESN